MDSPRVHFPILSKLAKERLIFINIQNIPHLKFLPVPINSVDKLYIHYFCNQPVNLEHKMKFKYREREQLFYTEVYNEKSSLTHFVRDLSIHDQEGSEHLQWETGSSYLKVF